MSHHVGAETEPLSSGRAPNALNQVISPVPTSQSSMFLSFTVVAPAPVWHGSILVLRAEYGLGHFSQKAVAVGEAMPLAGGSGGLVSVPQLLRLN